MCSIGNCPTIESQCYEESDFKTRLTFSKDDWKTLKRRSGCYELVTVCKNHELIYLKVFTNRHKSCCDPLNLHTGKKISLYSRVTLSLSRKSTGDLNLVPGTGLCKQCKTEVGNRYKEMTTPSSLSTVVGQNMIDDSSSTDESDGDERDADADMQLVQQNVGLDPEQMVDQNVSLEWNENPYANLLQGNLSTNISFTSSPGLSPKVNFLS